MNFLKNVGESVAAALSPLGECASLPSASLTQPALCHFHREYRREMGN